LIVERYLIREILKPMLLGIGLLILVFTGYTTAIKLAQAADGLLQPGMVARLVALNTLIVMEVLLPTALYLSIIASLGRLYRDSEVAALTAAGFSEFRLLRAVLLLAAAVAAVVAVISLFGRPWAYLITYRLEEQAAAEFDIKRLEAGQFFELSDNHYVLYAAGIDRNQGRLHDVFMQSDQSGKSQVIYAKTATLPEPTPGEGRSMQFTDGYAYLLDQKDARDSVLKFHTLTINVGEDARIEARRRKAVSTVRLATSHRPKDIAEFEGRTATPLATLLLAMLAVPLSRSAPRESRHGGVIVAILVYILFFNLTGIARNWVEQGKVGALPGIWWVYGLALGLWAVLMIAPWRRR